MAKGDERSSMDAASRTIQRVTRREAITIQAEAIRASVNEPRSRCRVSSPAGGPVSV